MKKIAWRCNTASPRSHLPLDALTFPLWWQLRPHNDSCDCGRPDGAHHRDNCSVTPIYAQTHRDTNQPSPPFLWPWLMVDMPECLCEPGDGVDGWCQIHGGDKVTEYSKRWQQ